MIGDRILCPYKVLLSETAEEPECTDTLVTVQLLFVDATAPAQEISRDEMSAPCAVAIVLWHYK